MPRRKQPDGAGPQVSGAEMYTTLRTQVLTLAPSSVGLSSTEGLPRVFGVVMDTTYRRGSATVVAVADGTTSLYTSTGGGLIGGGTHDDVARANAALLSEAELQLDAFADAAYVDRLPGEDHVRITILTYAGPRFVEAPEDDLGNGRHPAAPVFYAAHDVITALRLTEEGAAEPPHPPGGATPIMGAAHRGDVAELTRLLSAEAVLEGRDESGYTALMYAANAGQEDAVEVLIERGANPNAADHQNSTPLMFAAQHDHVRIVRRLLAAGANPNSCGDHGLTALGLARQNGHRRIVAVLVSAGAA